MLTELPNVAVRPELSMSWVNLQVGLGWVGSKVSPVGGLGSAVDLRWQVAKIKLLFVIYSVSQVFVTLLAEYSSNKILG